MFDYCGDIEASLEDYRGLLTQVIQETFPTGVNAATPKEAA